VLTPIPNVPAAKIQMRLARLGIHEQDIDEALSWARSSAQVPKKSAEDI